MKRNLHTKPMYLRYWEKHHCRPRHPRCRLSSDRTMKPWPLTMHTRIPHQRDEGSIPAAKFLRPPMRRTAHHIYAAKPLPIEQRPERGHLTCAPAKTVRCLLRRNMSSSPRRRISASIRKRSQLCSSRRIASRRLSNCTWNPTRGQTTQLWLRPRLSERDRLVVLSSLTPTPTSRATQRPSPSPSAVLSPSHLHNLRQQQQQQ